MKSIKAFLFTAIVLAALSGTVLFTACSKVQCSSVICQNGGSCNDGNCTCPAGFTGTFCETGASSVITFKNNTYTPITITLTSGQAVIPVGSTASFPGKYGTVAKGDATTAGSTPYGVTNLSGNIGLTINWNIQYDYPIKDTLVVPFDVGPTYFFLRVTNKNKANVIDYYANYNFPYGQDYEDVTIPNDGKTYDMGYYLAYPSSNVQFQTSDSKIYWFAVSVPFTNNQLFSVTVN